MCVLCIVIVFTSKKKAAFAWLNGSIATFVKRWVFQISVFVHKMTWKGFLFRRIEQGGKLKHITAENVCEKKISPLFLCLCYCRQHWLTALSQIRCNNGYMDRWKSSSWNSSYSSHGVSLIPSSSRKYRCHAKSSGLKCIEHIMELTEGLSLCTFRFHEIGPSLSTFVCFRTIISN